MAPRIDFGALLAAAQHAAEKGLGRNRPEEGDIGSLQLARSARSIRLADEVRARVGSGHSEQGEHACRAEWHALAVRSDAVWEGSLKVHDKYWPREVAARTSRNRYNR